MTTSELAGYIEQTNLSPALTPNGLRQLCAQAKKMGFYAVCVNPKYVNRAAEYLRGSDVKIVSVAGFPLGATTTEAKVAEAAGSVASGANSIDMVMDIGAAKDGDWQRVYEDILAVREAVGSEVELKVIIEVCMLSDDEKIGACRSAKRAGADFVKTSTGFSGSGATEYDVALIRRTIGDEMGIKASGGIRDIETAIRLIEAGATRIGTSRMLYPEF